MESEEPFSELEKECAQYVAGYVANRFSCKYPHLISHTDNSQQSNNWTQCISKGNLKMPSYSLEKAIEQLEIDFNAFHGDSLLKTHNIIKNLSDVLAKNIKHLNIPVEVVQCLVRTRTYIRLNNLNKEILNNQFKRCNKHKIQKFIK